jgi:hypothetical protein
MIQITLQIVGIPENAYENAKILQAQLVGHSLAPSNVASLES